MNYTVYIRKQNWLKFEQEEKKAELINNLLTNHYKDTPYDNIPETLNFVSASDKPQKRESSYTFKEQPSIPVKGVNLCKIHNLPLTVYGKCLQKGCKYA
jgi:hypothetical protein